MDSSYYILAVVNKTTYEATVGRGCVTCYSYTSYGGGCYACSNNPGTGWCGIGNSQLMQVAGGPRPMFFWEVSYPQSLEDSYGDDGYELGAFYPYTSLNPLSWSQSDYYRYAVSSNVVITFYVSGVYGMDYLARTTTYQYGSYRLRFELIFDEGGLGYDSRKWDYSTVVFLMKKLG